MSRLGQALCGSAAVAWGASAISSAVFLTDSGVTDALMSGTPAAHAGVLAWTSVVLAVGGLVLDGTAIVRGTGSVRRWAKWLQVIPGAPVILAAAFVFGIYWAL
ncbi:hypothetical protein [Mycolicibacterium mageritense]|uniref:hypothetical protein n=1 Tax=Mycolicibacterium mageritense TaxID=53462 RepID=UPI001E551812|nr:hypothetical protein [Mycolicibacterium mageritense]GJJ21758.1 hypothetical protein MTY414_54310 [Mycolicibacterium mageritense]